MMQGLADGYFILPVTIGDYLAEAGHAPPDTGDRAYDLAQRQGQQRLAGLLKNRAGKKPGLQTAAHYHRRLGSLLWNNCGIARNRQGLLKALDAIPELREEFRQNVVVPGSGRELNQALEKAGRVADFMEFAEIMVRDALAREESCGCHLREESRTATHEARRDDEHFAHVAVWEYTGEGRAVMHKEPLNFEYVTPSQRSYT